MYQNLTTECFFYLHKEKHLTCFFLALPSFTLLLRNLVRFSSFLYLCRFIFRRRISRTFLQLRGVAEPSPSSTTGTEIGGSTFSSSSPMSSSCRPGDSSRGGREYRRESQLSRGLTDSLRGTRASSSSGSSWTHRGGDVLSAAVE